MKKFEKESSVEFFYNILIRRPAEEDFIRISVRDTVSHGGTTFTKVIVFREPYFGSPSHVMIDDPDRRFAAAIRELSPHEAQDEFVSVLKEAVSTARPRPGSKPDELRVWEDFLREIAP